MRFDLIVEANGVEGLEEDFDLQPALKKRHIAIVADPKYIKNSLYVAPSIYGLEEIKEGVDAVSLESAQETRGSE